MLSGDWSERAARRKRLKFSGESSQWKGIRAGQAAGYGVQLQFLVARRGARLVSKPRKHLGSRAQARRGVLSLSKDSSEVEELASEHE